METFTRISVQKAHEIIGSANRVTIVDLRDAQAYTQGHIAQAQAVNDENIKAFLNETDKGTPLICYCYHGISSQRAADFFANQGFKEVYSIDGGWEEWEGAYG
jgi:thiosulfate sulfurtransferase